MIFMCGGTLARITRQIKFRFCQIPGEKQAGELGFLLWQEVPEPTCTWPLTVDVNREAVAAEQREKLIIMNPKYGTASLWTLASGLQAKSGLAEVIWKALSVGTVLTASPAKHLSSDLQHLPYLALGLF